uniref:DUF58 domain-containing protein n=1 Tax=Eubacterium cellulosolvens (strain ATCC 43171 / JCM 9499 / 6) TaxID=633697 RepID=I5AWG0_EUBC6
MNAIWRNRLIYLTAWILSVVGITFYGGVVSYGLFAVLTLMPVVSLCYLVCVIFTFKIYQEIDSKWVVANRKVPFYLSLVNDSPFAYVGIRVCFYSSFSSITGLDDNIEYELPPKFGMKKQTEIICRYRGEYEVGIKRIEVQDYFRLFRLSYFNKEPIKATVRPDYFDPEQIQSIDIAAATTTEKEFQDTSMDVLVRPYETGDDIRQINWKISARSGNLFVRQKIGEEQEGISILLGTFRVSTDPFVYLPMENKVLETVLTLSLYLTKKNLPYRTMYMQRDLTEIRCSALDAFDDYYEKISGITFEEDAGENLLFERAAGNREILSSRLVILIVQDWTEETIRFCQLMNENDVSVCVYVITKDGSNVNARGLAHVSVTAIDPHLDLREVL